MLVHAITMNVETMAPASQLRPSITHVHVNLDIMVNFANLVCLNDFDIKVCYLKKISLCLLF